jgi:hypothetical protein
MLIRVALAGALGLAVVPCGAAESSARPNTPAAPLVRQAGSFRFAAAPLTTTQRHRLNGSSWHPGCPVGLDDLRYVRLSYYGFDGRRHTGRLVVNRDAVAAVRTAFADLYAHRFPIRRMHLVDDYGASDYRSIEADNTSAFNCRRATGATRWSQHAYGRAVDVNTIENPYVYTDGTTTHAASRPYLDRSDHRKGMAYAGGVLVRAFTKSGWGWGGTWPGPTDYQHFSANGT